mmetsp:Transcript_29678/g.75548  ORF Transcript_29678/g.75548 Transcript_29678/m.75548 type:complete len:279 (-) Transcript_29678:342-1178(-)
MGLPRVDFGDNAPRRGDFMPVQPRLQLSTPWRRLQWEHAAGLPAPLAPAASAHTAARSLAPTGCRPRRRAGVRQMPLLLAPHQAALEGSPLESQHSPASCFRLPESTSRHSSGPSGRRSQRISPQRLSCACRRLHRRSISAQPSSHVACLPGLLVVHQGWTAPRHLCACSALKSVWQEAPNGPLPQRAGLVPSDQPCSGHCWKRQVQRLAGSSPDAPWPQWGSAECPSAPQRWPSADSLQGAHARLATGSRGGRPSLQPQPRGRRDQSPWLWPAEDQQ